MQETVTHVARRAEPAEVSLGHSTEEASES